MLTEYDAVHVGVATMTEAGLMVPAVRSRLAPPNLLISTPTPAWLASYLSQLKTLNF